MTSSMSTWLSYRPSDFLLFSAQTYHRLFELYNLELWPAQVVAAALALVLIWLVSKGPAAAGRVACVLLAACWFWVAWAFHLQRYATINWAATWFAAGFAAQGVLLALAAGIEWQKARGARHGLGLALLGFAVFVEPWLGLALRGRSWTEAELFAMTPDPTAVGTIGLLLTLRPASAGSSIVWPSRLLWPIPLLWCVVAALTQWTLATQG
ncbi:DUF6064 family protein [Variovorax sp. KK3]|uniref:DUF6064 family protein n=1 Tax=Variovorax sp. KK3 TaxID=1855728 RepID=UPI00097C7700|nr:DUF6064 family protein [Variovorax sp. KK3]